MNAVVGTWLRRERLRFWTSIVLVGALAVAVGVWFGVGLTVIA